MIIGEFSYKYMKEQINSFMFTEKEILIIKRKYIFTHYLSLFLTLFMAFFLPLFFYYILEEISNIYELNKIHNNNYGLWRNKDLLYFLLYIIII